MRKIVSVLVFSTCLLLNFFAWAAETENPVPGDAVKTMEKSFNIGPSTSTMQSYETSLAQDKLKSFYKKEMAKLGWQEQKSGFFLRGNELAILAVAPNKNRNNKTQFSVTTSRMPSKEEILAQRKAKPDKLDFMPVYPGSEQVFLWEMPTGISASYETKDQIKDVVFFYKSGMLNYGWSLSSETPLTTETLDCPECKKALANLPKSADKPVIQNTASRASLIFRKGNGESCAIRLYQAEKTTILVTYNANKKINP